ncbi:MAG: hypothetical protein BWY76_01469 [bacterium ADurb.Bin429]|nr:MAG: hypothetical protein BWY76_01469 [bacterium ADurb.Bin429]
MVEGGGVELNILYVDKVGAGTASHRQPVAPGTAWIRRVQVYLPQATGGEDGAAGEDAAHHAVVLVEKIGAQAEGGLVDIQRVGAVVR